MSASGKSLEKQLQAMVSRREFSQAIRKLQQSLKRDPDQSLTITEADLWLQKGQYEFERARYPQAEADLAEAVAQGSKGEAHYWLAKSLLAQDKRVAALEVFKKAFDQKQLPKDFSGKYLRLLMLSGQWETVATLVRKQASRFYAADLHWARGVLALREEHFDQAQEHFQKLKRPFGPNDRPAIWQAYAYQREKNWAAAAKALAMQPASDLVPAVSSPFLGGSPFGRGRLLRSRDRPAALARLILYQIAQAQPGLYDPQDYFDLKQSDLPNADGAIALTLLFLIDQEDFHDAAHLADLLLKRYPRAPLVQGDSLQALLKPLRIQAGNQALQGGEPECAALFWGEVVQGAAFDPKVAVKLSQALTEEGSYGQAQKQLQNLLRWVEKTAQQSPADWPPARLSATLARIHCLLADIAMVQGQSRQAKLSVKRAVELAPDHPEVIGRQGLEAYHEGEYDLARQRLSQALEAGCRFPEVYENLFKLLEETDPPALKAIRRRYGKHFGDLGVDQEVDLPDWTQALLFKDYELMERFVEEIPRPSPPLQAIDIFLEAASSQPSSSQKVTIDLDSATDQWAALLRSHPPVEQVEILKAIFLTIRQHGKGNQKGIAALQGNYLAQIYQLASQRVPGTEAAHLMFLAIKPPPEPRFTTAVNAVLRRAIDPANTLAKAQLELRRFMPTTPFRSFLEIQREKEPQNPLLLLALATLHPRHTASYRKLYQQSFDIARRLQDSTALQACREEEWLATERIAHQTLNSQRHRLSNAGPLEIFDILNQMANEAFGTNIPPELMAQMIPELMAELEAELDEEDINFLPPPSNRRRRR